MNIASIVVIGTRFFGVNIAFYDCQNEYQNEYQNDSERYVRIGTDTHSSPTHMSKKSRETGLICPIPTSASKPNQLEL